MEEEKLNHLLALEEENNRMLHAMRRSTRWQNFFTFIYWLFIVGSAVGVYYYFQPIIDKLLAVFSSIDVSQIQKMLGSMPR